MVELAIAVPLLAILLLVFVQVGLVVVDQVAVTQAAREGARAAAVDAGPDAASKAARRATGLRSERLEITIGSRPGDDGMVRVTVRYRSRVVFPLTGSVLISPQLQATAAMKVEDLS